MPINIEPAPKTFVCIQMLLWPRVKGFDTTSVLKNKVSTLQPCYAKRGIFLVYGEAHSNVESKAVSKPGNSPCIPANIVKKPLPFTGVAVQ